jgi:hypothetical protein
VDRVVQVALVEGHGQQMQVGGVVEVEQEVC